MPIFEETKKAPKKAKTQFDVLATKVREARDAWFAEFQKPDSRQYWDEAVVDTYVQGVLTETLRNIILEAVGLREHGEDKVAHLSPLRDLIESRALLMAERVASKVFGKLHDEFLKRPMPQKLAKIMEKAYEDKYAYHLHKEVEALACRHATADAEKLFEKLLHVQVDIRRQHMAFDVATKEPS